MLYNGHVSGTLGYVIGKCRRCDKILCNKLDVAKPQAFHSQNISQWKKDVAKPKRILLEGVRDHIVSNIHGK